MKLCSHMLVARDLGDRRVQVELVDRRAAGRGRCTASAGRRQRRCRASASSAGGQAPEALSSSSSVLPLSASLFVVQAQRRRAARAAQRQRAAQLVGELRGAAPGRTKRPTAIRLPSPESSISERSPWAGSTRTQAGANSTLLGVPAERALDRQRGRRAGPMRSRSAGVARIEQQRRADGEQPRRRANGSHQTAHRAARRRRRCASDKAQSDEVERRPAGVGVIEQLRRSSHCSRAVRRRHAAKRKRKRRTVEQAPWRCTGELRADILLSSAETGLMQPAAAANGDRSLVESRLASTKRRDFSATASGRRPQPAHHRRAFRRAQTATGAPSQQPRRAA